MAKYIEDGVTYKCPECGSERVSATMYCQLFPNQQEHEIDFETDVGDSARWQCEDCQACDFLPDEVRDE